MTYAGRTAVYHIYGADDVPLYIGVASEIGKRWDQHAKNQPWWDSIDHQVVTWHATRREALQAERDAIRNERPLHNIIWNGPGRRPARSERSDRSVVREDTIPECGPDPATGQPMIYLSAGNVVRYNADLFGGVMSIRDFGLIESACGRPGATAYGHDAYPSIWEKAAALFQSLARNHGFVDGNKRTAWLATAVFLDVNDHQLDPAFDEDAAEEFVLAVATGAMTDVQMIANSLVKFFR